MATHHIPWRIVPATIVLSSALQLVRALETYGEYFDHPGWDAPETKPRH